MATLAGTGDAEMPTLWRALTGRRNARKAVGLFCIGLRYVLILLEKQEYDSN